MLDDFAGPANGNEEEKEPQEEVLEPTSKYERIMVAALEASRLNEEIRRKGTKLPNKVTTEAIQRVCDGKVKALIVPKSTLAEELAPTPPGTPPTRETLFGETQVDAPAEESPAKPAPDADSTTN